MSKTQLNYSILLDLNDIRYTLIISTYNKSVSFNCGVTTYAIISMSSFFIKVFF